MSAPCITALLNREATDELLEENIRIFIREGYTGRDLVIAILFAPTKQGIAQHVSRLLLLVSKVYSESLVTQEDKEK